MAMTKKDLVESKIELLEGLLREANAAMYSAICESNGISDNEWTIDRTRWKAIPAWPTASFWGAMDKLGKVHTKTDQYFKPAEKERQQLWHQSLITARCVVDEFAKDRAERGDSRATSSLQRNIADAIYGVLRASEADLKDGIGPRTMNGMIESLVENGKLFEWKGDADDGPPDTPTEAA